MSNALATVMAMACVAGCSRGDPPEPGRPPESAAPAASPAGSVRPAISASAVPAPRGSVPPPLPSALPAAARGASGTRTLHVDCTTASEDHAGESLRSFRMGGPHGASFNWQGSALVCTVTMQKICEGVARMRLQMGLHIVAEETMKVSGVRATSLTVRVPAKTWEADIEPASDIVYDRLLVVARVDGKCPEHLPELTFHHVDGFVGGFGGGE